MGLLISFYYSIVLHSDRVHSFHDSIVLHSDRVHSFHHYDVNNSSFDFSQRFSFGQFIHQFIQLTHFFHEWVLNCFNLDPANFSFNEHCTWIVRRSVRQKLSIGKVR